MAPRNHEHFFYKLPTSALFLVLVMRGKEGLTHHCRSSDTDPYLDFGTKTYYEHARNKDAIPAAPGCEPIQIWMYGRHGTRYPSQSFIRQMNTLQAFRDQIVNNYNANKTGLCQSDVDSLQSWTFTVTPDQGYQLTEEGRRELQGLGRRLAQYFPQLLNTSYSPDKFIIRHSSTSRTKESAEYFAKGVFGDDFEPSIPHGDEDDRFISGYNYCDAWVRSGREELKKQNSLFEQSQEMRQLVRDVSKRLGFDSDLSSSQVVLLYYMCVFDQAWSPAAVSPWCSVFSTDELKVLEYREDLNLYYFYGPGDNLNIKLACPLLQHMFNQFKALESDPVPDHPLGMFYFGHDTMVDMLDSALRLSRDQVPLKGDNYPQQAERAFRNSRVAPFTANIAAVLFRCSSGADLKVLFLRSEHPVVLPGCADTLCDWSVVKQSLGPTVEGSACSDTSYCSRDQQTSF